MKKNKNLLKINLSGDVMKYPICAVFVLFTCFGCLNSMNNSKKKINDEIINNEIIIDIINETMNDVNLSNVNITIDLNTIEYSSIFYKAFYYDNLEMSIYYKYLLQINITSNYRCLVALTLIDYESEYETKFIILENQTKRYDIFIDFNYLVWDLAKNNSTIKIEPIQILNQSI